MAAGSPTRTDSGGPRASSRASRDASRLIDVWVVGCPCGIAVIVAGRPEPCTGSRLMSPRIVLVAAAFAALASACSGAPGSSSPEELASSHAALNATPQVSGSSIANLALANVGGMACATNSLGGTPSSRADGQRRTARVLVRRLRPLGLGEPGAPTPPVSMPPRAASTLRPEQRHAVEHAAVGDAVVFDYQGGGVADHVAIVTQVNCDGTIESVSGDWNGTAAPRPRSRAPRRCT